MSGIRTAPPVNGIPIFQQASFRWMDWTNDIRTDTYLLATFATDILIEALGVALQAGSNASLYEISVSSVYTSVPDSTNAAEEVWENVSDNLVIQAKRPTQESIRCYVPSPINGMFIDTTNDIDPTSIELLAILTAFHDVIPADNEFVGARFTSRRQINQQVKF